MAGNYTRAISRMLMAVAFLSVLDVLLKLLTPHYSAMQVSTLRGIASIPFVLVPLIARRPNRLRIRRWEIWRCCSCGVSYLMAETLEGALLLRGGCLVTDASGDARKAAVARRFVQRRLDQRPLRASRTRTVP